MSTVKILMTINNCCDRVKFLTNLLHQARELNLSDAYQVELEHILLDCMACISNDDEAGVISIYQTNIDNVLSMRDVEFTNFMNEYKNKYTPPVEEEEPPP